MQNTDSGKTYEALQAAVDAASSGDRLTVRGTCVGKTVIDRDLVLVGIRTATSGKPTLSGVGKVRVVETDKGVRVKLRGLVLMRGGVVITASLLRSDGYSNRVRGTGILNRGHMVLRDVLVTKNGLGGACGRRTTVGCDSSGWGALYNTGTLVLNGASSLSGNWDGIYNTGTLVLNGASSLSSVSNHGVTVLNGTSMVGRFGSHRYRGSGVYNAGRLTLNDASRISGKTDGVWNAGGTLTLNGTSHISGNEQGVEGSGRVTLNDASAIRDNHLPGGCFAGGATGVCHPFMDGGGVYLYGRGALTLNDSSTISGNSAPWYGGGVAFDGYYPNEPRSLTMTGSSTITGNTAGLGRGGVSFNPYTATLTGVTCGPGGNVFSNSPDDCKVGP